MTVCREAAYAHRERACAAALAERTPHRYVVSRAQSFEELREAYRLVYERYCLRGYIDPWVGEARVTLFNLLPDTATFVLTASGAPQPTSDTDAPHTPRVLGTVTAVLDHPEAGLPLGECFSDSLLRWRDQGRRVAEAIMLSRRHNRQDCNGRGELRSLLELLRFVADYARLHAVDDLCIQVHPHHVDFYVQRLAFEVVDGPRPCPSVRNHPAVLLRHDMHTIVQRGHAVAPKTCRFFLSHAPDPAVLEGYRPNGDDVLALLRLAAEQMSRPADAPHSAWGVLSGGERRAPGPWTGSPRLSSWRSLVLLSRHYPSIAGRLAAAMLNRRPLVSDDICDTGRAAEAVA